MSSCVAHLAASLLCTALATGALAQDRHRGRGHADNHDWYRELKQPGTGYSCCNDQDCRPTRAYQDDDGNWRALINGRWVAVPPKVVLQRLAPDGNSHVCASSSGLIYCFLGGSPKG